MISEIKVVRVKTTGLSNLYQDSIINVMYKEILEVE